MHSGATAKEITLGTSIGTRIDVFLAGRVLHLDVPAADVSLEVQSSRSVPEKLTYTLPRDWVPRFPTDPANSFGQRSQLTIIQRVRGRTYETPMGLFTHGSKTNPGWEETDTGVSITAFGLLQLACDNDFPLPSSPPAGATLKSEAGRLSGMPVILEGMDDVAISSDLSWGYQRLEALEDLCASNGLAYRVKTDSYLHIWKPKEHAPDVRYTFKDALLSAPRKGLPRGANIITMIGTSGSGDDSQQWIEIFRAFDGPYDPGTYGSIMERIELQAASRLEVNEAGKQALRMLRQVKQIRSLSVVLDPRVEIGDVVNVVTDLGEHVIGRVVAISATWKTGEQMRIDVEVYG